MATNLAEFAGELQAAEQQSLGAIEGYEDILVTDIMTETKKPVSQILASEQKRLALVKKTREALNELVSHGYPAPVVVEADDAAISDIMQNIASMQYAVSRLGNKEAKSASMSFGPPALKP